MTDSEVQDVRRRSFDAIASDYEAERPGYPPALFDDMLGIAHVRPGSEILEIGCGTGKATRALAARGLRVTAIELGAALAAIARTVLADLPVTIHVARFEDWDAPAAKFELAVSAQAYHWLDPAIAGAKIAQALRPGAVLACFWNAVVEPVDWLTEIYERHAPEMRFGEPFPSLDQRVQESRQHLETGGALEVFEERRYPWTMRKTAEDYVRLIDTYSDHRVLAGSTRVSLYGAIQHAIDARGGVLDRAHVAYLLLARARG